MSTSAYSASDCAGPSEDVTAFAGQLSRRRPTRQQGRALEVLAHAVEYLIDSRSFEDAAREPVAIELLKRANRQVFLACRVVESLPERVARWFGL
jgi:hypothetical protein